MRKLNLAPSQDGYTAADPADAVLRARVGAGPSRTRLDMLGAPSTVNATFQLDPLQYQYWRAFFRSGTEQGSEPFLMDLLLDHAELTEHEVKIIPGSTQLGGVSGMRRTVRVQLEVKPIPADFEYEEALLMLYEEYGEEAPLILSLLEQLVNEDLPQI